MACYDHRDEYFDFFCNFFLTNKNFLQVFDKRVLLSIHSVSIKDNEIYGEETVERHSVEFNDPLNDYRGYSCAPFFFPYEEFENIYDYTEEFDHNDYGI